MWALILNDTSPPFFTLSDNTEPTSAPSFLSFYPPVTPYGLKNRRTLIPGAQILQFVLASHALTLSTGYYVGRAEGQYCRPARWIAVLPMEDWEIHNWTESWDRRRMLTLCILQRTVCQGSHRRNTCRPGNDQFKLVGRSALFKMGVARQNVETRRKFLEQKQKMNGIVSGPIMLVVLKGFSLTVVLKGFRFSWTIRSLRLRRMCCELFS